MEKKQKNIIIAAGAIGIVLIIFLLFQIITQKLLVRDGTKYLEQKEYEKAYESFYKAEKKHTILTSKKNILYYEGECLILLGRYEDAVQVYGKITDRHKEARAFAMKGFAYQADGQKKRAQKSYEKAIDVDKKDGIGYYYLYGYYIEEEQYQRALDTIEQALKGPVNSWEQELVFGKIVVYEKMLEYDKALEAATAYVKAYPDDETGKREQEFLETR